MALPIALILSGCVIYPSSPENGNDVSTTTACSPSKEEGNAGYVFGVIADCQYCALQGNDIRKYSLSIDKLTKCVVHFNTMELEYVIHLGDFIDRDFENFDVLNSIYDQLIMPKYHVLGNHDFSVSDDHKKDVPQKMGMPARYYDYEVKGWRYVVLDGNDISFYAYPKNSEGHRKANEYYTRNKVQSPKWNGAIGVEQLSWLRTVLETAARSDENVILFCHFPIYPENDHHNLWNAKEIIALLEEFPCVKAYIDGHNHKGNYGMKEGIHYLTLKGMVDTDQTSYAVIEVGEDHLEVTGYGREENRVLEIRK